jgi:hypothetical protein
MSEPPTGSPESKRGRCHEPDVSRGITIGRVAKVGLATDDGPGNTASASHLGGRVTPARGRRKKPRNRLRRVPVYDSAAYLLTIAKLLRELAALDSVQSLPRDSGKIGFDGSAFVAVIRTSDRTKLIGHCSADAPAVELLSGILDGGMQARKGGLRPPHGGR